MHVCAACPRVQRLTRCSNTPPWQETWCSDRPGNSQGRWHSLRTCFVPLQRKGKCFLVPPMPTTISTLGLCRLVFKSVRKKLRWHPESLTLRRYNMIFWHVPQHDQQHAFKMAPSHKVLKPNHPHVWNNRPFPSYILITSSLFSFYL